MKTKKTIIFLLIIILAGIIPAYGQTDAFTVTTPSAASLKQQVDFPVNHSTGNPDISIPIYNIQSGSLSLPLTFSFNMDSYMKFMSQFDMYGIGWSLSTDIQISRSINGEDDFKQYYGYYVNTAIPFESNGPKYDNTNIDFMEYKYRMYIGEADEQPDKFYYRLMNKSGAFFFRHTSSSGTRKVEIVQSPNNGLKIEYNSTNSSFTIYDTDGTKYSFPANKTEYIANPEAPKVTWKCDKIISANGKDEITFAYDSFRFRDLNSTQKVEVYDEFTFDVYGDQYFSMYNGFDEPPMYGSGSDRYWDLGNTEIMNKTNPKVITYTGHKNQSALIDMFSKYGEKFRCSLTNKNLFPNTKAYHAQSLATSSITFRGGRIQFTYEDSPEDLYFSTRELKEIAIYNTANDKIRSITLHRTGMIEQRVLTGITDGEKPYLFGYSTQSPDRVPNFWGYAGACAVPRYTNIPVKSSIFRTGKIYYIWELGCIAPLSTFDLPNYKPIFTIEYPTKGKTIFNFERNRIIDAGATKYCGGYRVKDIQYLDANDAVLKKKIYKYGRGENGGGTVKLYPHDKDCVTEQQIIYYQYNGIVNTVATEMLRTYHPFMASTTVFGNGSSIFYDEVAEYESDMGVETGKTIHRFKMGNWFDNPNNMPYEYVGLYDFALSYPESVSYFKYTGDTSGSNPYTCVAKTEYQYEKYTHPHKIFVGVLLHNYVLKPVEPYGRNSHISRFVGGHLGYSSGFFSMSDMRLKSKKECIWADDGMVTEKTTGYQYSLHNSYAVTRTETKLHDQTTLIEEVLFPKDYSDQSEVRNLINNHILSVPVTQTRKRNGVIISADKHTYNSFGQPVTFSSAEGLVIPDFTIPYYKLKYTIDYDPVSYLPRQVKEEGGMTTSYLWSFNGMYVVAEIQNATYSDVALAVQSSLNMPVSELLSKTNNQNLEPLKDAPLLKDALVTTYSYKPLIGVSSAADARGFANYYDYDAFGRLKDVYFKEGTTKRILENYQYIYNQ